MNKAREFCADDQRTAAALKKFHFWAIWLWVVISIPVLITGLKNMVWVVVLISLYANIVGHISSWQSTRVEVQVQEDSDV